MTAVLVTGGAGFVGSQVCCGLVDRHPDWQIVAMDNLHRRGSELNLKRLTQASVSFVHGDVRVASDWPNLKDGPDFIIDCSAEPSVLSGIGAHPNYTVETNLLGTYHCLEYARRHQSAVIFISTSRVYPIARLEALPFLELSTRFDIPPELSGQGVSFKGIAEDFPLSGARSLYGSTKLASELLLEEYSAAYGFPVVVNRCGAITGPGQMGKVEQGVFALWMAAHYFQQPLIYIGYGGQGKQVRDFLHVADLVDLLSWQLQHLEKIAGMTLTVGGGRANSLSLAELTELCQQVTGHVVPISNQPQTRPNDVRWYISDLRQACVMCDWHPCRDTGQMAEDIYRWLRTEEHNLAPMFVSDQLGTSLR